MDKQQILDAVRAEITETNKALGIAKGFRSKDYIYLGVVAAALERVNAQGKTAAQQPENERVIYHAPFTERLEKLNVLADILSRVYFHGHFLPETANERLLLKILFDLRLLPATEGDISARLKYEHLFEEANEWLYSREWVDQRDPCRI